MRYITLILLCLSLIARADFKAPDFAFPKTVIKDAEKYLNSSDGLTQMQAVMEIVTAQSSISPDSVYAMSTFIDKLASAQSDDCARGLMLLYEASVLRSIYMQAPYKYDRVEYAGTKPSTNPADWSGAQFKQKCSQLTDSSIRLLQPWYNADIRQYSNIIEIDQNSKVYYPKLRDFIFSKAMDICPEKAQSYKDKMLAMLNPGTAEWAVWAAKQDTEADVLQKLFDSYPNGDCGAYMLWLLVSQYSYVQTIDVPDGIIDRLRDFIKAQPPTGLTDDLQRSYERFITPSVEITYNDVAGINKDFRVICRYRFANKIGVDVSHSSGDGMQARNSDFRKMFSSTRKVEYSQSVRADTLIIKFPKNGNYRISPVLDSRVCEAQGNVLATPWIPVKISGGKGFTTLVTDISTGAPAKGVKAELYNNKGSVTAALGVTSSDGLVKGIYNSREKGRTMLKLSSNKDGSVWYGEKMGYSAPYISTIKPYVTASVSMSQPVYHFGDSAKWAVVVLEKNDKDGSVSVKDNIRLSVILRDANYKAIDTLQVATDKYGRTSGAFILPDNVLAGRFSVQVLNGSDYCGGESFTVSDFKVPEIEIKRQSVVRSDTDYNFEGVVSRYSGASVSDGMVTIEIDSKVFTGTTDGNGSYKVSVPFDSVATGFYRAKITAVSPSGETATMSQALYVGKEFRVVGNAEGNYNVDHDTTLPITVEDCSGQRVTLNVKWTLTDIQTNRSSSGVCLIDSLGMHVDWRKIPASFYKLKIDPMQGHEFEGGIHGDFALYSIVHDALPDALPILVPEKSVKAYGQNATLTVGVGKSTYLYVVSGDSEPIVEHHKLSAGFHKIKIKVNNRDTQRVTVFVVNPATGQATAEYVEVENNTKPEKAVKLIVESMRDRLVPGSSEHWRVRLTDNNGQPSEGALIATIYNHSLDALASLSWTSTAFFAGNKYIRSFDIDYIHSYTEHRSSQTSMPRRRFLSIPAPKFLYEPTRAGRMMIRGGKMLTANKVESANEYEGEMSVADAVELKATTVATEAPQFVYRETDVLSAAWHPNLVFDEEGCAWLDFTVPNTVGTWALHATAWDKNAHAASIQALLTASKPLMLEMTLPRFLRQGDEAQLGATLSNMTDTVMNIIGVAEVFDPISGNTIATMDFEKAMTPNGKAYIVFPIEASENMQMIGVRMKATDGYFTDGEQSLLPILESATTVIDANSFYLNEANPTYTASIPAQLGIDDVVAIEYCQNPIWEVVKTLPGLYESIPTSSTSAASSAYAALMARGLMKKYPQIGKVLNTWLSNPEDSALVSRLVKNEDLKILRLAQTPFIASADANTARMERLALTFNDKVVNSTLSQAIGVLQKLQNSDGGFSWGSWNMVSSPWITKQVIYTLGRVKAAGFALDVPETLLDKAFKFIDKNVKPTDVLYAEVYSLYPNRRPSTLAGEQCIDAVTQSIIKGWKKFDTARKAQAALLMWNTGHKSVARQIMTSIEQFAQQDKIAGIHFGSVNSLESYATLLQAFSKISRNHEIVNGMRQWLVLQTQSRQQLACNPMYLISALLESDGQWLDMNSNTASVTIDGKAVDIDKVEVATGTFSKRIAPSTTTRTLCVQYPGGASVAYGSLVTVSARQLSEVKPQGNTELSVEKVFLVKRNGNWQESRAFVHGEQVMVQITIKAGRDLDFVTLTDQRPASFEPVNQMPEYTRYDGNPASYRVNTDTQTQFFIDRLPKGVYRYKYLVTAAIEGSYTSGIANVQSQYAPEFTARSGAEIISVKK